MSEVTTKEEAKVIVENLRKELGDKLSSMTGIVLEGVTAKEMATSLVETIELLWKDTNICAVLPEKPEVEIKYRSHPPAQVYATAKNESAKRVMQLLNLMQPTHRIKKGAKT